MVLYFLIIDCNSSYHILLLILQNLINRNLKKQAITTSINQIIVQQNFSSSHSELSII